ncbi:chromosomal replication initiator protein DnaA [bacterium]|nr:chromosomal replication initiator protein DnaA [bacterium]
MKSDWTRVKQLLSERIDPNDFQTWIEPIVVDNENPEEIRLRAPNKFVQEWFNEHYATFARDLLYETTARTPRLTVGVAQAGPFQGRLAMELPAIPRLQAVAPAKRKAERARAAAQAVGLNERYDFKRFVVGSGNQFAFNAAMAVANDPGRKYNPLFFYGDTGLGKTHLLHAVGHHMIEQRGATPRVVAMTCERFTNELIQSLRARTIASFRKKFRQVDVLLVDDVQFLAGKERTQEEFFHTFNELHGNGAQIVVTCDRPPHEIDKLEDRLRSRFGWGLIADIQMPDLETRVAILRSREKEQQVVLPQETAYFLAENFSRSVRELEGAFVRLSAYASLHDVEITTDLAREVLKKFIDQPAAQLTVEQIQKAVCDQYGVRMADLLGARRQRAIALPRQIASYLTREMTELSYPEIGYAFGGRDHTTIMHAHRKIGDLRSRDPRIEQAVVALERRLRGGA